jgi:hypothetical protein
MNFWFNNQRFISPIAREVAFAASSSVLAFAALGDVAHF